MWVSQRDPQKGINAYEAQLTKRPHDQALTRDYAKELEELRTSADRHPSMGTLLRRAKSTTS